MAKKTFSNPGLKDIIDKFSASRDFRRSFETKWDEYYRDFRNSVDDSIRTLHRSNLFIPYVFQVIETILPRMIANRPKLFILPREEQDREQAKLMQELLDYQWVFVGMEEVLEELVLSGLIYGTGILKVDWDFEAENPKAEQVDILNFYADPEAVNPETLEWCILRTLRTKEYIKEKYGYDVPEGVGGDTERANEKRLAVTGSSNPINNRSSKKMIEVWEYWTPKEFKVVVDRKYIVKENENAFGKLPFIFFRDYIVPSEFYGIGEIEHIHYLQEEANSLRNQIMDNNNLLINNMWKVRKSGGINPRNLVSKPGGIIPVSDMADIEALAIPGLPNYVFNLQEVIKGDIQQTTGVTDYQIGTGAGGTQLNDTATGIGLIQEAGNQRFKIKIRHLEQTLRYIGNFFIFLNQNLITKPKVIRIVGQQGVEFKTINDLVDLRGNFDLEVEAGSTKSINPDAEIQKFQAFVQFASLPQFTPFINWQEILMVGADKFDISEKDRFIKQDMGMGQMPTGSPLDQLASLSPEQQQQAISTLAPDEQEQVMGVMNGQR